MDLRAALECIGSSAPLQMTNLIWGGAAVYRCDNWPISSTVESPASVGSCSLKLRLQPNL